MKSKASGVVSLGHSIRAWDVAGEAGFDMATRCCVCRACMDAPDAPAPAVPVARSLGRRPARAPGAV